MAKVLFIKPEDVKKNTVVSGNVDMNLFTPFIYLAQDIHIQNLLGTKLYLRLKQGVENSNLTTNERKLLNDYIQDALIWFSFVDYLPFNGVKVANGGTFKHFPENASVVDQAETDRLIQKGRDFAQHYSKRLVDYLKYNKSDYPEYSENEDEDMRPQNEINYSGGWYLKDDIE